MDPNAQMCQMPQVDVFELALVAPSMDPTPTSAICQLSAGKTRDFGGQSLVPKMDIG